MKIEKVTYQHPFIIGPFLQRKVGFEASLDEGEDPKEALNQLKAIAEEWDKESNPGQTISEDQEVLQQAIQTDKPAENRIAILIGDIQKETVLRLPDGTGGLDAWKLLADRQPALKEAYETRRKQIIDGEIKDIMEKTEALIPKK